MKRRLARICPFLLLGAIINVLVAWGCLCLWLYQPRQSSTTTFPAVGARALEIQASKGFLRSGGGRLTSIERIKGVGFGVNYILLMYMISIPPDDPNSVCLVADVVLGCGWPIESMRYTAGFEVTKGDAITLEWPLRPGWPGFAINTVFYAAILWLLFALPFALRRRRRIKRGLCPKCAYDLRGRPSGPDATVCPECGAAVARSIS